MEILGTKTFKPTFDYSEIELQALKVVEEACEVHKAARKLNRTDGVFHTPESRMEDLEGECADVLQATFNLLDMLGFDAIDVRNLMMDCRRKNELRGRYE